MTLENVVAFARPRTAAAIAGACRARFPRVGMAVFCVALSASATAQTMPKQFDFSVTYTWVATSRHPVELGGSDAAVAINGTFVATNDAGGPFMHNMFGQCSYVFMQSGGPPQVLGACTYEDKDGDKLYEPIRMAPGGQGELRFTGGTGKFAGIQCEGKYAPVAVSKDRTKGIGKKTGTCRMP